MSRIFGIVDFSCSGNNKEALSKMTELFARRCYSDSLNNDIHGAAAFGVASLNTTPESLHERQPLRDGAVMLCADARIDNRVELISVLAIHPSPTEVITDADIILRCYLKYGMDCSKYLVGDFAFALWDAASETLLLIRDHLGIRPLYFLIAERKIYFASDLQSLSEIDQYEREPDLGAIRSFALYGSVGFEQTMYKNIYKVPAAHTYTFTAAGVQRTRYWKPENISINKKITFEEAANSVRELLEIAVRTRLRSNGLLGCELSGGIDSTTIASVVNVIQQPQKLKTFSMRYRSYGCDEWEFTKSAIDKLNADYRYVDVDKLDFHNRYDLDSSFSMRKSWPFFASFTQNMALAECMQENSMKVILTGHGGDNLFTGSMAFLYDAARECRLGKVLKSLFRYGYTFYNVKNYIVIPLLPDWVKKLIKSLIAVFVSKKEPPEDINDFWTLDAKLSNAFMIDLGYLVGRHQATFAEMNYYVCAESQYGIEFRHPFFDVRLVEFALSLPTEYKLRDGQIKAVLREAVSDLLPPIIRERNDKAEFSEALRDQIDAVEINILFENSLLVSRKIVEKNIIDYFKNKYSRGILDEDEIGRFWRLITVERWLQLNFNVK